MDARPAHRGRHSRRGWLAFDPKGHIGERTYGTANALCNPGPMPEIVENETRLLANAAVLAGSLKVDVTKDPLGYDKKGQPVYLKDIWPSAKEIADAVVFLASDAAHFINGALIDINGGRFLR